jgi:hypothetical protein
MSSRVSSISRVREYILYRDTVRIVVSYSYVPYVCMCSTIYIEKMCNDEKTLGKTTGDNHKRGGRTSTDGIAMSRLARRENILRARKQEKLKWQVLNKLGANVRDPQVGAAAAQVIAELEPQLAGGNLSIDEQVQRLVPYVSQALAGLPGEAGGAQGRDAAANFANLMGDVAPEPVPMPYHAVAGEADPYAALIHHQVRIAEQHQQKVLAEAQQTKTKQAAFLRDQVDFRKRAQAEERAAQLKFDLQQQEVQHAWERAEAIKMQEKEQRRRADYQEILAFQQETRAKVEAEKARAKQRDQDYLETVRRATLASKERDRQDAMRWMEEAKKTKIANDARLGVRREQALREKEEDKARIRVFEARQKAADEARQAGLDALKRNQEVLTNLGRAAVAEQEKRDALVEEQIQAAVRLGEEKARRVDEEKARKKATFKQEQLQWRQQERQRKEEQIMLRRQEELREVEDMRIQFALNQSEDARKIEERRRASASISQDLRRQIYEKQVRSRKAKVEMSPAELSMNAQVLSQFSPARPSARSAISRAGQSIIF